MRITTSNNNNNVDLRHQHHDDIDALASAELIVGGECGFDSYDKSLPTIELPCSSSRQQDGDGGQVYASATMSPSPSCGNGNGALAVAEMVNENTRSSSLLLSSTDEESEGEARAEFISATVFRENKLVPLGIGLKRVGECLTITSLSRDAEALFRKSVAPFRIGDALISINNTGCEQMDELTADRYLDSLIGTITVIAHNEGDDGNPNIVASMITKRNADDVSGIGFRTRTDGPLVSSISSAGLFASSLLNVGDQVRTINGVDCAQLDSWNAASVIKTAPKTVTIVAKTHGRAASVVAASTARHKRAKYICATVYKPTAKTKLGISFQLMEYTGNLKITSLSGLLRDSPFCVGDILFSINRKKVKGMNQEKVARHLQILKGEITLVAHNRHGDEKLVEAMVTKPPRPFPNSNTEHKDQPAVILRKDSKGRTIVYNVNANSFKALSFKVGEMMSINGVPCDNLDLQTASDVIGKAQTHVTIVAKKRKSSGGF